MQLQDGLVGRESYLEEVSCFSFLRLEYSSFFNDVLFVHEIKEHAHKNMTQLNPNALEHRNLTSNSVSQGSHQPR